MAGGAALISGAGLAILMSSSGNPAGVFMFVLGLIATAVFALLSLFSVFTSVSILGVALGVAALTIVLAVTTGFQKEFRDKGARRQRARHRAQESGDVCGVPTS